MDTTNYTISEVAEKLNLSTKTLRRWEEAGKFKSSRTLGNQRRYSLEDLQILDAIKHNLIAKQDDLLNLPQAASLCGVSPSSIERWVREGKIHPFITAGKTYYPKPKLLEKLDTLKHQSQEVDELDTSISNIHYQTSATQTNPQPSQPNTSSPVTSNFKQTILTSSPPPTLTPLKSISNTTSDKNTFIKPRSLSIIKLSPLINAFITILIILVYHLLTNSTTQLNKTSTISPNTNAPISHPTPTPTPTPTSLTTNSLTLSPISPPNPIPGTLYFDAGSQSLRLFTDTWTDLSQPPTSSPQQNLNLINTNLISGTRILKKGTSNTLINNKNITPSTPIIVTFTTDYSPAKKYWLEQAQGSFTLHTDYPVDQNSTFTYLILAPTEPQTSPSPSPSPITF